MTILIVEDHPNLARITAIALREMGCRTFTANSIATATEQLEKETIDGIFLDVNLGAESGFDFLAQLVAQPARPPVIMFTAQHRDDIAAEAQRRGALGCLIKPFNLDDLRQQIEHIERHRREQSAG